MKKKYKNIIMLIYRYIVIATNIVKGDKCQQKIFITAHPHAGNDMIRNLIQFYTNGNRFSLLNRPFDKQKNRTPLSLEFFIENDKTLVEGDVICYHLDYTKPQLCDYFAENNYVTILFMRDPRDVFCSKLNRVKREHSHPYHEYLTSLTNYEEQFLCLIQNFMNKTGTPSLYEIYSSYYKWCTVPNVLLVKYEDLMGSLGPDSNCADSIQKIGLKQDLLLQNIENHIGFSNSVYRRRIIKNRSYVVLHYSGSIISNTVFSGL